MNQCFLANNITSVADTGGDQLGQNFFERLYFGHVWL